MSHENGDRLWDNGDNAVTCFEIKAAAMAFRGRSGHVLRGRRARRMEMPRLFCSMWTGSIMSSIYD
jgi:hypothetical protein